MHLEDYAFETFLQQHENQLESSAVPKQFWYNVYKKISEQIFDIGSKVSLLKIEYDDGDSRDYPNFNLQSIDTIEIDEPENVFLIDHAWTFRVENMHENLLINDSLRERMSKIVAVELKDKSKDCVVDEIFDRIWRYTNYYTIGNAATVEDRMPVWYIMDEVGCSVTHADDPNVRIIPFCYIPERMTYSLLFPVKNIELYAIITRDFVENISTDSKVREANLLPWIDKCFLHESFDHINVDDTYYLYGHTEELLPDNLGEVVDVNIRPCKVYTEYEFVEKYLTNNDFEIVDDESKADVLWYTKHFKDFKSLRKNTLVNQFPFEYVLTIKDLLAVTCRSKNDSANFINATLISNPTWLPTTYNLKTELVQFISYFQRRAKLNLDNHWIIKPFNLARSLDTHITNNLSQIIRLSNTGSKIVQKYIENPVMFYRDELTANVKFDIRYVIAVRSIKPLQVYVYKQFFLRFANKAFALNNFHVYEQHFTVMNYKTPNTLKHMKCDEFVQAWNCRYDDPWSVIQGRINDMLLGVFECASAQAPPRGVAAFGQSRAVYAVDLMLEQSGSEGSEIQPKLLEVNWTPDCQRACEYYPEFYRDIFALLFLGKENSDVFDKL